MDEQIASLTSQIMAVVAPIIVTSIGIIATWLLNELRRWATSKTNSQVIDTAFNQLNLITKGAVVRAEQLIKEFTANGKITAEEGIKLKSTVFKDIKTQIPKSTEIILKKNLNNFDDFIDSKIEEMVYYIKQDKNKECL